MACKSECRQTHPGRLLLVLCATVWLALMAAPGAALASPAVSVFPSPGTQYNRPTQQIAFRGLPAGQLGTITVRGSVTGLHTGKIAADSDGNGGSFLPSKPFAAGETVTVTTSLNVRGGRSGTFSFKVAHTDPLLSYGKLNAVPAGSDGVLHFRSEPGLQPASVTVLQNRAPASEGDIFVAPQFGPVQTGPMILDPRGNLIWFQPHPMSQNLLVTNFQVQHYQGQPVLTWWQGNMNNGHGRGEGVIMNDRYQQIGTVHAANGLDQGLHEFLLTPRGDAWITASSPVRIAGTNKPMVDSVIQEIDVKTGLVLFEWHAADHVPLRDSYFTPSNPGHIFDPFHANSIDVATNGDPVISMRDTSAIYEVDRNTGRVVWTLGGKASSFRMGPGTFTWGQHNAILYGDGTLTAFDDGGGPPRVRRYSRGIRERLDTSTMTATLVHQYSNSPQLAANFEGSLQQLSDGNMFLGWGQQPNFSEFTAAGRQIFNARFTAPTNSYRAYRFAWSGHPASAPSLVTSPNSDGSVELYASWNGATNVSRWRILGGSSSRAAQLQTLGTPPKRGFETAFRVDSALPRYAVQALDSSGHVLGTSPERAVAGHLAIYGHSAFIPAAGGLGGIPVACFEPHPCHITTSVWQGRSLLARSGAESMGRGDAGVLYFRLAAWAQRRLRSARGGRLPVRVVIRDSGGATVSTSMTLIAFHSSGRGPRRSLHNSSTLRVIGVTDFVSRGWVGGILSGCLSQAPCHVTTTLRANGRTIATTGREFLGADELGYLFFRLTPAGHAMLERARGHQLAAQLTVSQPGATSRADIALIPF